MLKTLNSKIVQRRKRQAEQRRAAMVVHKPKAAPPVRMEELRALNMIQLDPDDAKARIEQAQKPKGIIPSGGFTNFRCCTPPLPCDKLGAEV